MDSISRLLKPRSVAVIGASADATKTAGRPVSYLVKHGFAGAIYPVNPKVDRLLHVKGALIWNITREDYGKSKVPKMIGSRFYKNMTARNANTTRKLLELMAGDR